MKTTYAIKKEDEVKILNSLAKKLDYLQARFEKDLNLIFRGLDKKFDRVEKKTKTKIDKAKKQVVAMAASIDK